jgi:hypothetical protein
VGYQPRIDRVKDEKGDLVADFHSILVRWMNHFCQLLNIHVDNDVIHTEIHTAGPHEPEMGVFVFELAIDKVKSHKSPVIYQIPAELIKAWDRTFRCAIHKLIICIWKCEELPERWKESTIAPFYNIQHFLVSDLWSRQEEQISLRSFFLPSFRLQSGELSFYQYSNNQHSFGERCNGLLSAGDEQIPCFLLFWQLKDDHFWHRPSRPPFCLEDEHTTRTH